MLAFYYHWSLSDLLGLSLVQLDLLTEGLSEILDRKYNSKRAEEEEFEKEAKLSALKINMIVDTKKKKNKKQGIDGPIKLSLGDLASVDKKEK